MLPTAFDGALPRIPDWTRHMRHTLHVPLMPLRDMSKAIRRTAQTLTGRPTARAGQDGYDTLRLHLDTQSARQISAFEAAQDRAAKLVADGDWPAFSALMAHWNADKSHGDGRPLVLAAARAARAPQINALAHLPRNMPVPVAQIPFDTLDTLEQMFAHHHDDPMLGAVLAFAHLEIGAARRGGGHLQLVSKTALTGFSQHLERAHDIVAEFPDQIDTSLVLGLLAHRITLDAEWATVTRHGAFRRCLAQDPRCWDVMSTYARHLLPRWGGAYELLDRVARAAMSGTPQYGAAAYAAFYKGVLHRDEGALFKCDPDLFAKGLADLAQAEDSDPVLVNELIQYCFDLVGPSTPAFGAHYHALVERREAFAHCADALFLNHFRCHVPEAWRIRADEAKRIVTALYTPVLNAGGQVRLTLTNGIERPDNGPIEIT